jgi:RNA polymerase sigma-70 factor (ECF subfamily)
MKSNPPDKQSLLMAARHGSRDALGQLLQAYRPLLLVLARDQLPSGLRAKGGASDLVQDTYVDAFTGFDDFKGHTPAEFCHWLEQAMRHNACDFGRRFRDTDRRQVSRERRLRRPDLLPADTGPLSQAPSPIGRMLQEERAEALQQALARLSEDDRRLLLLHHRDHLPFEEVAWRLGCTAAAARQRCVRALEHWRRAVEDTYGSP